MACRSAAGGDVSERRSKAIDSREEGQPGRCPFQSGAGMDAKTRDLVLFAALALFCAGIAWIMDHAVFGSTFFALGAVGIFGAAERYWR